MHIRYNSQQTSQPQNQQPTLRQVLTHSDPNLLLAQQQQSQQQQQHVQHVVSSTSGMQQQRNLILLPSGQSATIIRSSIPLNSPNTTSGSTILIGNSTTTPQISQQTSNMVPVNVSNVQLASSSSGGIIEPQQIYQQPTVQNGNISNQQYLSSVPSSISKGVVRNNSSVTTISNITNTTVSNTYNRNNISPSKTSLVKSSVTTTLKPAPLVTKLVNENNTSIISSTNDLIELDSVNKVNIDALSDAAKQTTLIDRVNLDALLKNIDGYSTFEDEAGAAMLQLTEDFVDEVINGVVMLSHHKGSKKIETSDVCFFLKSRFDVSILPNPKEAGAKIIGGGSVSSSTLSTDASAPKRRALAIHEQRLAFIDKTLKKI